MSQSKLQIDPERMLSLVLVRVLLTRKKPINLTQLVTALCQEFTAKLPSADVKSALEAAAKAAERCKYLTLAVPARGKALRPTLTDAGRQQALGALGLKTVPSNLRWSQARRLLALHTLAPRTNKATFKTLNADAIARQILVAQHGLPDSISTLNQAVERLAWRALDVDTTEPFTAAAVQRHLLRALVPADTRARGDVWRRMLAMSAVQATGHTADALSRALLVAAAPLPAEHTTLKRIENKVKVSSEKPKAGNDNSQPSLAEFAATVREAARSPEVRHFHGDRAFIGSVWEHMRERRLIGDMSLDDFKTKLVSAHRKQMLEIVRADLVGAMDPNEVRRSEARFDNATFHFVALNAGGM